jgi:peptidyl-prolyl cis-trans isomerase C
VNGEPISLQEVDTLLKSRPLPQSADDRLEMRRAALEMLIDDALLRQFLRKNAKPIRASEINKKLAELQGTLKSQGQSLQAYCQEAGQTEAQLRATIVTMLQREAYIAEHLTDAAVRSYFDENRDFFDQSTVRTSHILLRIRPGSTPAQVAAAKAKLEQLRKAILSGTIDFARAAQNYSECASAPHGGDIGYFPRKGLVEEPFARAAFALKKDEISEVVQTSYGLHLIQATDRKSGPAAEFAKIAPQVHELAGEEMILAALAKERAAASVEIKLVDDRETAKSPAKRPGLFGSR